LLLIPAQFKFNLYYIGIYWGKVLDQWFSILVLDYCCVAHCGSPLSIQFIYMIRS